MIDVALIRTRIKAVGWSRTARLSGVDRITLHRCFGPKAQSPSLRTLQAVLPVIGLKIEIREKW